MGQCSGRKMSSCSRNAQRPSRVSKSELKLDIGTVTVCADYFDFQIRTEHDSVETVKLITSVHMNPQHEYMLKVHCISERSNQSPRLDYEMPSFATAVQYNLGVQYRVTCLTHLDCASPLVVAIGMIENTWPNEIFSIKMFGISIEADKLKITPIISTDLPHKKRIKKIVATQDLLISADDTGVIKVWQWEVWSCKGWRNISIIQQNIRLSVLEKHTKTIKNGNNYIDSPPLPINLTFIEVNSGQPYLHLQVDSLHLADSPELEKMHLFSGGGDTVQIWHIIRQRNTKVFLRWIEEIHVRFQN